MHSQLHTEYQRAAAGAVDRRAAHRGQVANHRPKAPPGRLRSLVAHTLAASALRLDREVARRAVV